MLELQLIIARRRQRETCSRLGNKAVDKKAAYKLYFFLRARMGTAGAGVVAACFPAVTSR